MPPRVGDIYSVYSTRLRQYVACQVTALKESRERKGAQLAAVLQLDWSGDALPQASELGAMRPLVADFFFWRGKHDHAYASAEVPAAYTLAGNIAPLVLDDTTTHGDWHAGDTLYRQRAWEQIDLTRRQRFKAASGDVKVTVGGHVLRQDTRRIDDTVLQSIMDFAELDQLPCLMHIHTEHGTQALADFVKGHPFITELLWRSAQVAELDLRASCLGSLSIDASGLAKVLLNRDLGVLVLRGEISPQLQLHSDAEGRALVVYGSGRLPGFAGLDHLAGLSLSALTQIDLDGVLRRFPHLTYLQLQGKPGMVSNLSAIAGLAQLQTLSLHDLFGYTPEQFPSPQQLPRLSTLWLSSVPFDVAQAVKHSYKNAAAQGLDLSVTQPRKPAWLDENLHNPFRDWDGREQISTAQAKKAATAYKTLLSATRAIDASMDAEAVQAALSAMVAAYVTSFNQLDARNKLIGTVENEEIHAVLAGCLRALGTKLADVDGLLAQFDRLREF
ncbi:hypothetical protein [Janthinobacterium psychrotolerans]|uniref:Gliding motility protein n=1 Tax=Janthinobacterium psychrotolerans TaxID=1747903 RepID=A0A1A7C3N7_9BURK|nr:hypothetical protein [Janthinobacterium psychrotolerans]OBV39634.1 hypothetical protein ASR47_101123 [Janthinobacterium psychrotolerans]